MLLAGTLGLTVMPPAAIVKANPSALRLRPLAVSAIVKLLIAMLAPSTKPFRAKVGVVGEIVTSAADPGPRPVAPPPAAVTQLLLAVPSETAQTLVAPLNPPFQNAVVMGAADVT